MSTQATEHKLAIQWLEYPSMINSNPFGDFNQIVSIYFRPPAHAAGVAYTPLRLKIGKHDGQPSLMTEEEFRDVCVNIALASADKPVFV